MALGKKSQQFKIFSVFPGYFKVEKKLTIPFVHRILLYHVQISLNMPILRFFSVQIIVCQQKSSSKTTNIVLSTRNIPLFSETTSISCTIIISRLHDYQNKENLPWSTITTRQIIIIFKFEAWKNMFETHRIFFR